jgi:sortase A
MNPYDQNAPDDDNSYLLAKAGHGGNKVLPGNDDAAANLIRDKLRTLYEAEPSAKEELAEAEAVPTRSKHQEYMHNLSSSGKSLAEIQTAWHAYYASLPDKEKHEVWQEFYAEHNRSSHYARNLSTPHHEQPTASRSQVHPEHVTTSHPEPAKPRLDMQTVTDIKRQLLSKIDSKAKDRAKHHLKSLGFGLMMGSLSLLVLLFGFFNERFVAPFITPSKAVSSTPIIIDSATTPAGNEPKIVIPKINVEIPVVYYETSGEEKAVDKALERGVVHYATTPNPGEKGNAVIFGHSSNNILNPGKYKFAFVLLSRLENGDTFTLVKDGKRYVYKVYEKRIVKPSEVSVLDPRPDKVATATLITCDPPGTSLNRLVVVGEQISPDPATNTESTAIKSDKKPATVLSNAPSLWQRLTDWLIR